MKFINCSLALLALGGVIFTQTPAIACFSVPNLDMTREEAVESKLEQAEIVFVGKPVRVSRVELPIWPRLQNFDVVKVEFEVSQTWKGPTESLISIYGFDDSCNPFSGFVWELDGEEWREVKNYSFSEADQQEIVVLADYPAYALGKARSIVLADQILPSIDEIIQHLGTGLLVN